MMYIFVAKFSYGRASLAKVQVTKETPKTFVIAGYERVLGSQWLGKVLLKSKSGIFRTPEEAMAYLIEKAEAYVESCENALDQARERVYDLYHETGRKD